MQIAFVGLGVMGAPIAARLLRAGHALSVFDLRREAAEPLLCAGARWSEDPARGAELAFTSLPGPQEVEAWAPRLLGLLAPGAAWFDLSTNSPQTVQRIHGEAAARGIRFLDAPVSGGPRGAQSGRFALWVGGDRETYERALPVLSAFADRPFYVGSAGAGTVAKLAHNAASFMVQTALAEAMTLGVKAGVEPLALFRALRQGATGRARTFDRLAEQFLPGRFDPPAFALRLAHKDMTLALALARSLGVPMRAGEHALAELEQALARGWGERDARVAMTLQEERAGVAVRVSPEALAAALAE
ncbi:MAG: NAD(P)-dependent oxidoreductase [Burkholderiales bacterium]|nr:NAD(P)-dependent oxidoreductase [Burkholderiales bacterium]